MTRLEEFDRPSKYTIHSRTGDGEESSTLLELYEGYLLKVATSDKYPLQFHCSAIHPLLCDKLWTVWYGSSADALCCRIREQGKNDVWEITRDWYGPSIISMWTTTISVYSGACDADVEPTFFSPLPTR